MTKEHDVIQVIDTYHRQARIFYSKSLHSGPYGSCVDEIWGNVWLTSFPAQTHSIYLLILHNSPFTFSYLHQQSSPSKNLVCFSCYHPSRSMRLPAVGLHSVHIQVLIGSLTSFSTVVSKMPQKNATCKYFLSRPSSCMYSVGLGLR